MLNVYSTTVLLLVVAFGGIASGQQQDRVCSIARYTAECEQLQRGVSEVVCVPVQDSIECAQRIRNGTADFGVFSAESVLLTASLGWVDLTVVKELRSGQRAREPIDFQAAVVVRSRHTGGLDGLRGLRYCHPGLHYGRTQRWTERVLKHFERLVAPAQCDGLDTVTEMEAAGLSNFFGESCRPGVWSQIPKEDADLKEKYRNLCSLCPNTTSCAYDGLSNPHQSALQCLERDADVVYASVQEVKSFFTGRSAIANEFSYLCPDGSLQPVTTDAPCSWITQPWATVMASSTRALHIAQRVDAWERNSLTSQTLWEGAIIDILTRHNTDKISPTGSIQSALDYIRPYRAIPVPYDLCQTTARWCTTSAEEKDKCDVLSRAALTTGVLPNVECNNPTTSRIACLKEISAKRADFAGIDSNYGYLARQSELTAAMYQETEKEKYSSVVVLVHEGKGFDRFEKLRNAKACFPEFGGIASIAFVNVGRSRGIFDRSECDYSRLMSDFFSESCAPGSRDDMHDPTGENSENLCALCRQAAQPAPRQASDDVYDDDFNTERPVDDLEEPPVDGIDPALRQNDIGGTIDRNLLCAASETNRYYGTRGALRCLQEAGDVAIIEAQNLADHALFLGINQSNYRVLCRNGTLAAYTGLNVDEECYLTTIVDGEIVVRRQWQQADNVVHVLSSLDVYLQNDPDFRMYNIFGGTRNLLFEDSALGLVSPQHAELGASVKNYIRLFENIEDCQNASPATLAPGGTGGRAAIITVNIFLTLILAGVIAWRL